MNPRFDREESARLARSAGEEEALGRLVAMIEEGDHDEARALFDALVAADWRPTQGVAEALLTRWAVTGEPEHAAAVVACMQTTGVTVTRSVRARMVEAWARAGRAAEAHAALDAMVEAGDDPGGFPHQAVMAAWAKAGAYRKVLDLRRRLIASGREPDAYHDRYLVEAFARAGELSRALQHLEAMAKAGHRPGDYEYGAIADACVKHRDPTAIEALRAAMEAAGVEPNVEIEEAVVTVWARSRARDQAKRAFDRIPRSRRTAGLWWAIMLAYVRDRRLADAEAAFWDMLDEGVPAERRHYRLLVEAHRRALADRHGTEGDPEAVMGWLRHAIDHGIDLDLPTYASAADALAMQARPKAVREIIAATHLWGPPPDRHLFRALITAEIEAGNLERATAALDEMATAGLSPTHEDIALITRTLEARGERDRAAEFRRRYPQG